VRGVVWGRGVGGRGCRGRKGRRGGGWGLVGKGQRKVGVGV